MKQPLKHSVQNHLNQQRLSSTQLKQLHALQQTSVQKKNIFAGTGFKAAMIAASLIVLMTSLFILKPVYFSIDSLEQQIAEEVANNHLKLKPLEVSSQKLDVIKAYFTQLGFLPSKPSFLSNSRQTIIGGRYCSIQGVTALQLRLVDKKTGKIHSLYETEYDKKIFKDLSNLATADKPLAVYANGVKVYIWVEKDILFVLTD